MAILSKACKPHNFQLHNSLKLGFTIFEVFIQILLIVNLSLNQTSPDILALCETNLDDSIESVNFSMRGYLPFIRKDSQLSKLSAAKGNCCWNCFQVKIIGGKFLLPSHFSLKYNNKKKVFIMFWWWERDRHKVF